MKRLLLTCLLSTAITLPALAALKVGDTAPNFNVQASLAGKAFNYSLKDSLKKGTVVVYFYPSAFTGGCNVQAHFFAENNEKFIAAGATIVGVSLDSIARLNEFSADPAYCAGKIAVASDTDGKVAKAFDLSIRDATAGKKDTRGAEIDHGFTERTTYIVTADGKIAATIGGVSPTENVDKALEAVQKLAANRSSAKKL